MKNLSQVCLFLSIGFVGIGCQVEADSPPAPTSPEVGAEEDLGDTFDPPSLAFRADGSGFVAKYSTHQAMVADGAIRLTPVDFTRRVSGDPVTFTTSAIRHGSLDLGGAATATTIAADGTLAIGRGPVVELIENREVGVEQSWRFDSRPAGAGDLTVAVTVTGHGAVEPSPSGLHFQSSGGLAVGYSNALWIDADGASWDVPVVWAGRAIEMRVPADVLAQSSYPAVLDPVISAELGVDVPVTGFTGARAREPAIAWSQPALRYLAVWRDDRTGRDSEIFAARIRTDGTLVDVHNIAISKVDTIESEPTVAWVGSSWLVAWDANGDIRAATVSTAGAVTQLGTVAATAAVETAPSVASNGAGGLLAWQSDADIRGATFSGSFGASFAIATGTTAANPTVAGANGGDYLVAWDEGAANQQDVRGQLVTAAGALSGAAITVATATGAQSLPSAAFDGTDFVVAWRDRGDIAAGRITTAGAPLDGATGVVVSASAPVQQTNPSVGCDSSSCLIAWEELRTTATAYGIFAQRVSFTMTLQGAEIVVSDLLRPQNKPAVAARTSGFSMLWEDWETGVAAVRSSRIGATGAVLDAGGVLVNDGAQNAQQRPAYARSNTGQLAAWADSRSFGDNIMARRYTAGGAKLDAGALTVSDAQYDQNDPSVDYDGTQYVVAWHDARNDTYDIFAARFQEGGMLSDTTGIAVSTAERNQVFPDVASGGGVSLVVWQDRRVVANVNDIYGAIVSSAGTVSVADIGIVTTTGEQEHPQVAWDPNGAVFVVVWSDERAGAADIYAARVGAGGTVLDPGGVLVSGGANEQFFPAIATSGTQLLVAWEDYRTDPEGDIYGSRLDTSGALNVLDSGGIAIATGASAQLTPTLVGVNAPAAGTWGIAWVDDVNRATLGTDIYGNTMSAAGALAGASYVISATADWDSAPSFQSGVNNRDRAYLMYNKARIDLGLLRVRRRSIRYP